MSQFSTLNLVYEVIKFLLFSLGIYKILGKLGANRRWMSWLPGLRYFALGNALDLHTEGIVCGVLEVLYLGLGYLDADWLGENGTIAVGLFVVVVAITLYIYRIRLFMRTLAIFHLRRRWVWLWLVANWLCFLILGLSKKIQPQQDVQRMEEEELAGTAPAELAGVKELQWKGPAASGLSIDVRERTVKDFGKKRYLLKDIVMDIPNGSMVLLLGGSGAGKTTFVNAVIGYEKADAEVFLNGRDVYRNYDEVKYRIGFVPQQNLIRATTRSLEPSPIPRRCACPRTCPGRIAGKRPGRSWTCWASPPVPGAWCARNPAASSGESPSPWSWWRTRSCSCWMSPTRAWTASSPGRSSRSCGPSRTPARSSWSSPTARIGSSTFSTR